jgi:hypothetical protein
MNFPRFFLSEPGFASRLEACLASQDDSQRTAGFLLFAYDVCTWFDENPTLQSVQLSCMARAEMCDSGYEVRMRHHIKLSCIQDGAQSSGSREFPKGTDAVEGYAFERLPWSMLANGTCTIQRTDALVVKALSLDTNDAIGVEAALYHLALRIDSAFKSPGVIHDLGLTNVHTE